MSNNTYFQLMTGDLDLQGVSNGGPLTPLKVLGVSKGPIRVVELPWISTALGPEPDRSLRHARDC